MIPPKEKSTKNASIMAGEESVSRGGVGGGGTLILPYIRRLGSFLRSNFEFQYFGFFFQTDEYFGSLGGVGYDETVNILSGPSQNWTIFGRYL